MAEQQNDASPATAGGTSTATDDLRAALAPITALAQGFSQVVAVVAEQMRTEPDTRDIEIKQLRNECAGISANYDYIVRRLADILDADEGTTADVLLDLTSQRLDRAERERGEYHEEWKRADAEVTRLNRLVGNENVPYDGWDQFSRHDAIVRCEEGWQEYLKLRDERDDLRQQLDQHLADENSAQAANDRLRDEIEQLRPSFQPGQRVRVGDCAGTVYKGHDVTRVKLDGVPIPHDFETRFVRPTPYDEEVPF
jgi:chromosome segregation ATPase